MAYPMCEAKQGPLRVDFDRRLKEDVNDAGRLSCDPVMRAIVDRKGLERSAASSSRIGRFEMAWLASDDSLAVLTDLSSAWIDRARYRRGSKTIVLDIDSSVSPTHGDQEGSSCNGHFGCSCYHPLFVFNQFGDLERCGLRPGHVHSAEGWHEVLEPVVDRYRGQKRRRYFRADAALASREVYAYIRAGRIRLAQQHTRFRYTRSRSRWRMSVHTAYRAQGSVPAEPA